MSATECRHCGRRPGAMARGLCGRCYQRPGIRGLYAPVRRGPRPKGRPREDLGLGLAPPSHPHGEPTATRPGTEARMDVYTLRLERGEPLFHPLDFRWGKDGEEAA